MNGSLEGIKDVFLQQCKGIYCGHMLLADGSYSNCGACARGYRPDHNMNSMCVLCEDSPSFRDWLYLGFMAFIPVILHWFFIDYTNTKKTWSLLTLYALSMVEAVLAAIITLLISQPMGSFTLTSCSVQSLSDWYTMFYNPKPDYTTTVYCTQEAVYPLYSMVIVYYAVSLLLMLLVRPIVSSKGLNHRGTKSIYAAMYFFPILVVVQAVLGGLLYYYFPYIIIVASLITLAIHLTSFDDQDIKSLLKENFCSFRNVVIVVGHWLLQSYSIVSITEVKDPRLHIPMLLLAPFPFLFYVLTVRFTRPSNLEMVG